MTRLVLALDSATESCTAALFALSVGFAEEPFEVVAARRREAAVVRGGRILLPLIQELLDEAGAQQQDIAAVVVGEGPGTFTGVRVAVATARAIALALNVPIYGQPTLAALASKAIVASGQQGVAGVEAVVPVVDARRGQVFAAVYRQIRGLWRAEEGIFAVAPADLIGRVQQSLAKHAVGEQEAAAPKPVLVVGARNLIEGCSDRFGVARYSALAVDAVGLVCGQSMLKGGFELLKELVSAVRSSAGVPRPGETGSPESVRPIYVRPPDADIHITKMKDPWA